jgi:hypothetical protein
LKHRQKPLHLSNIDTIVSSILKKSSTKLEKYDFPPTEAAKRKDHRKDGLSLWSRIRESNPPSRLGKLCFFGRLFYETALSLEDNNPPSRVPD